MAITIQNNFDNLFGNIDYNNFNVEDILKDLKQEQIIGEIEQRVAEQFRARLTDAATASGGVISAREKELIDKAVNGTMTAAEEQEFISLCPPGYFGYQPNYGYQSGNWNVATQDLIQLLGGLPSPASSAAAAELRLRASRDGYISPELNDLLNRAAKNGSLGPQELARLQQLLQVEDAL